MDLQLLIAASIAVNRFTDFVKPYFKGLVPDAWQDAAIKLVAVLAGVVLALSGQLNILAGIAPTLPALVGQIATGVLAGFGSEAIYAVFAFFYAWRDAKTAEAEAVRAAAKS